MAKRRLNVIFFVDSARTRSFTMPLGRLNVAIGLLIGLVTWSAASVAVIVWLGKDREIVAQRLRTSLATVFAYETRYDGVYDIAYPSGKGDKGLVTSPVGLAAAAGGAAAMAADAAAALVEAVPPAERPKVTAKEAAKTKAEALAALAAEASATNTSSDSAVKQTDDAPQNSKTGAVSLAAKAAPSVGDVKGATSLGAEGSTIVVGNPVVESRANALELRFDLTNKADDRAEGYIWAVAEFKADGGPVRYIGAPFEIAAQIDGYPKHPERSAIFGIKRFKRKSFTFPITKGQPGTFTGLKIGVLDRSGAMRTTYNVPIEVRVDSTDAPNAEPAPPGPQSG